MKLQLRVKGSLAGLLVILSMQLTVPAALKAQQNVGAIIGVVRDPSGALVPDAAVTARSVSTGVETKVKSNSAGAYAFPSLPIGEYAVTVRAPGFKTLERPAVRIVSSETVTLDLALEVGQAAQTVKVTGRVPTVNTTTTTAGTTRVTEELNELPLLNLGANRSVMSFLRTFPGVSPLTSYVDDATYSQGIANTSINGAPEGGGSYTMDGVFAANTVSGGLRDDFSPPPQMVDEMRLNATNTVEYGANAGVGVVVVTKSGTNQVHGDVFEYLRNEKVDSRNFNAANVTPNKQNEFGFTLGGPVYLPKIYNGKDKTFFFGMYSGYRFRTTPAGVTLTTATPLMQQGDFSEWLGPQIGTDALGRPIYQREIYDPATTRSVPDPNNPGKTVFVRDPFAYNGKLNVLPPSMLSPISQFFGKYLPAPTRAGTQLNWVGSQVASPENTDKGFVRVDHSLAGGRQRITAEWDKQWRTNVTGGNWGSTPITTTWDFVNDAMRARLIYTATFGSNKVFGFRIGGNRYSQGILFDPAALTGFAGSGLKTLLYPASPNISIDLLGGFGMQFGSQIIQHTTVLPVYSDLSWALASHNVKFGASYIMSAFARIDTSRPGSFGFSNLETGLPGNTATGLGFASFLTGWVDNTYAQTGAARLYRAQGYAFYAEDSWRVAQKLTLNYGLRLDYFINTRERHDQIGFFDPALPNPGAGGLPGADSFFGTGPGRNGLHNIGPSSSLWSPRFGFAYNVTSKTVFRGSYGLSTSALYGVFGGGNNLPYSGWSWSGNVSSLDRGVTPAFNWTQTLGIPISPPPLPRLDPTLENGSTPQGWNPKDIKAGRVQNINAGVERQLPGDILLNVSYVGTLSHGLPQGLMYSWNQLNTQYLSLGNLLSENVNSAAAQAAGIKVPYPGFNSSVAQALLPFPQYHYIFDWVTHTGYSEYNALQVSAQKRVGQGLSFLIAYTNSKQLTNLPSFGGQGTAIGYGNLQTNSQINNKALGQLDRPQNLSLSWVYQLPFGPGKRYANTNSPLMKQLVGGWQVAGLQQYTSGDQITVATEQGILGNFGGIWPNRVPGVPITSAGCGNYDPNNPVQNRYLNNSAFADPVPFTFGNTRVLPNVRNCPYFNENFSIQKIFQIHERSRVLFSADFTNLFNRHTWLGLNTDIDNASTFGRYTGATDPRLIQFHVELEF